MLLGIIFVCLAPAAYARDESKPNLPPHGDAKKDAGPATPDIKVETMRFGKVISVGPDGKVETKEYHGEIPREVLDKLPKEIQDRIKMVPPAIVPGKGRVSGKMKIVVVRDGQQHEYEADVGEGGVLGQLPPDVVESLKPLQGNLPSEAQEALKAVLQNLRGRDQKPDGLSKGQEEINAKLDQILERLDQLQREVATLKAKPKEPRQR